MHDIKFKPNDYFLRFDGLCTRKPWIVHKIALFTRRNGVIDMEMKVLGASFSFVKGGVLEQIAVKFIMRSLKR